MTKQITFSYDVYQRTNGVKQEPFRVVEKFDTEEELFQRRKELRKTSSGNCMYCHQEKTLDDGVTWIPLHSVQMVTEY